MVLSEAPKNLKIWVLPTWIVNPNGRKLSPNSPHFRPWPRQWLKPSKDQSVMSGCQDHQLHPRRHLLVPKVQNCPQHRENSEVSCVQPPWSKFCSIITQILLSLLCSSDPDWVGTLQRIWHLISKPLFLAFNPLRNLKSVWKSPKMFTFTKQVGKINLTIW